MKKLILGKAKNKKLSISTNILQRHFACFGSSCSGKTVACIVLVEERARNEIPIIAFDPQGDIASLVEIEDEDKIKCILLTRPFFMNLLLTFDGKILLLIMVMLLERLVENITFK
ncbi:MAG: DUF87 domain-containing protein [Armatimonadetes bacterium]|nr:DUF87 domain-containing protein [Armatimonadota bacterium]